MDFIAEALRDPNDVELARKSFVTFDEDKNGTLTLNEFLQFMNAFGKSIKVKKKFHNSKKFIQKKKHQK